MRSGAAVADGAVLGEHERRAGRGVVALAFARAYHLLAGYAVALLLPRLLGSPEVFGLYSKAAVAIAIFNNVLIAASVQTVSKLVAVASDGAATYRRLLAAHLAIGAAASGAIFASASAVAVFHRDPALIPLLRVIAIVPLGYAGYAAAAGYLNAHARFVAQARLDALFYTLRVAGVLGTALVIGGALGPAIGLSGAAVAIGVVALAVVGIGARGPEVSLAGWAAFAAPLWVYHLILNALLELDLQVLARAVSELARGAGRSPQAAADLANAHVGFYHAAQRFAFTPYHLMLALTLVVFPMIARASDAGDEAQAKRTIRSAFRVALLSLLAVACPIAGAASGVMRLAYPDAYLAGAPALRVLSFGLVAFALFVLAGTVLASASKPRTTALIAAIGLVVAVACNYVFVRRAGIGEHTLVAAALGTSAGMFVAMVLALAAVYRRFRALLSPLTLLRAACAGAAGYAAAAFVPHDSRLGALAALAAGLGAYLVILAVTRELTGSDRQAVRRALSRG